MPQEKTREARGSPSSKLAFLRKHPIFCDLEPDALDQLCRYARHATFKRGAPLFSKGDPGTSLFAVVSGTVKMHIEPSMSADFGSAKVKLLHPEQQLLAQPGIYSYRAEPYGTYPAWFDPTYFHERIVPVFSAKRLLHRDARNIALSFRYLFNHPEAWILLALLLIL